MPLGSDLHFDKNTNVLKIDKNPGVNYVIDGVVVSGTVHLTEDVVVVAEIRSGFTLPENAETEWIFKYNPDASDEEVTVTENGEQEDGSTPDDVPSIQPFASQTPTISSSDLNP